MLKIRKAIPVLGVDENTEGSNVLNGGSGADHLSGTGGDDILNGFGGSDQLQGNSGNDLLDGGDDADDLWGGAGNDTLLGGAGDDTIHSDGDSGTDYLDGGTGNDRFEIYLANAVRDTLVGGEGVDSFHFKWADLGQQSETVVLDFAAGAGGDRIDVEEFLINSASRGYFASGNPFAPAIGILRLKQSGADTLLQWDGDGAALDTYSFKTLLTLKGVTASALTSDNFTQGIRPDGVSEPGQYLQGGDAPDKLSGTFFDDTLVGGAGRDSLDGASGNDRLEGGSDADLLDGGMGNDTLLGGDGNDWLRGSQGDDSMDGGAGDDFFGGTPFELGNDTLVGGDGDDGFNVLLMHGETTVVDGGAGDDRVSVWFGTGSLQVKGGDGVDTFQFITTYFDGRQQFLVSDFAAGAGGDLIDCDRLLNESARTGDFAGGNPFNPALGILRLQQSGADTLLQWDQDGAAGNRYAFQTVLTLQDVKASSLTADNFKSGLPPDGSDAPGHLQQGGPGPDYLRGAFFNDTLQGLDGTDQLMGSGGNDLLDGGRDADQLLGDEGDDTLSGGEGDDSLCGGQGDDWLDGGAGNDTFRGGDQYSGYYSETGNDTMVGGEGDDAFYLSPVGDSTVLVDGGEGDDQIWAFFDMGDRGLTRLSGILAKGGEGVDTFHFTKPYFGGSPHFVVSDFAAGAGGDRVDLDTLLAGSAEGRNPLVGDPFSAETGVLRWVQSGTDALLQWDPDGAAGYGAGFRTMLTLQGVDAASITSANYLPKQVSGTSGADKLIGDVGDDALKGGTGRDILEGAAGDDVLRGGGGRDELSGGAGRDLLIGGAGTDRLSGGEGTDVFRFTAWRELGRGAAADVITDFFAGVDRIDLSKLDADHAMPGRQALSFVSAGFGSAPGQVAYANGVVSINTDTDAKAEFQIKLLGKVPEALTAADFVL